MRDDTSIDAIQAASRTSTRSNSGQVFPIEDAAPRSSCERKPARVTSFHRRKAKARSAITLHIITLRMWSGARVGPKLASGFRATGNRTRRRFARVRIRDRRKVMAATTSSRTPSMSCGRFFEARSSFALSSRAAISASVRGDPPPVIAAIAAHADRQAGSRSREVRKRASGSPSNEGRPFGRKRRAIAAEIRGRRGARN